MAAIRGESPSRLKKVTVPPVRFRPDAVLDPSQVRDRRASEHTKLRARRPGRSGAERDINAAREQNLRNLEDRSAPPRPGAKLRAMGRRGVHVARAVGPSGYATDAGARALRQAEQDHPTRRGYRKGER